MTIHYPTPAASLPPSAFQWLDVSGAPLDFSSGWTFKMTIGQPPNGATITKTNQSYFVTNSITPPPAGQPNLTVNWAPNELLSLSAGRWRFQITATQTSNGASRVLTGTLVIDESVLQ
jgi:hypothetical protein